MRDNSDVNILMLRIKKPETRRITNNLFREISCYSKNRL